LAQPVGQTTNTVSGLPAGRAKRVNPPSPPYLKKSSYESTSFFSHFICLYGSELKYYTFSPLLIKQNHLIFLLPPFFILTFQHH
ncbi:hypothetical protein, partial [Escherichia coli]|uniref:hypothetical protein n=2 Tax=Escherichia coli TaxID=562 RepID=UPI001BFC3B22